jgi:hypothetical protein
MSADAFRVATRRPSGDGDARARSSDKAVDALLTRGGATSRSPLLLCSPQLVARVELVHEPRHLFRTDRGGVGTGRARSRRKSLMATPQAPADICVRQGEQ